jgi:hypothetical protein
MVETPTIPPEAVEAAKTAVRNVQIPIVRDDGAWVGVQEIPRSLVDRVAEDALTAALPWLTGWRPIETEIDDAK